MNHAWSEWEGGGEIIFLLPLLNYYVNILEFLEGHNDSNRQEPGGGTVPDTQC